MSKGPDPWIFNDKAVELWENADAAMQAMVKAPSEKKRSALALEIRRAVFEILALIPETTETLAQRPKPVGKRAGPSNG